MTKLREHLQAAKREYADARYPGELAGDVRAGAGRSENRPIKLFVRTALALAAVVALLMISRTSLQNAEKISAPAPIVAENTNVEQDSSQISLASVSMPRWTDVTAAAMPSFPSVDQIDAESAGQTLDNQENE